MSIGFSLLSQALRVLYVKKRQARISTMRHLHTGGSNPESVFIFEWRWVRSIRFQSKLDPNSNLFCVQCTDMFISCVTEPPSGALYITIGRQRQRQHQLFTISLLHFVMPHTERNGPAGGADRFVNTANS